MPTLPDYPEVSLIQDESPGLQYGSPNLWDEGVFGSFLSVETTAVESLH